MEFIPILTPPAAMSTTHPPGIAIRPNRSPRNSVAIAETTLEKIESRGDPDPMTTPPSVTPLVLVLTNDDGIDAPGLDTLRAAVESLEDAGLGRPVEFWVVAPAHHCSGCGHQVTTDRPLHVERRGERRFAVHGTPADCARVAYAELVPRIDWVLSGINAGGNLGVDVHHSGTVAACREAAILGLKSIALSHYHARGRPIDWTVARGRAATVLLDLLARPLAPGEYWNVNLPHPAPGDPSPTALECPLDVSPMPVRFERRDGGLYQYSGDYQARPRVPDGDVALCFGGAITCTRLRLERGNDVDAARAAASNPAG